MLRSAPQERVSKHGHEHRLCCPSFETHAWGVPSGWSCADAPAEERPRSPQSSPNRILSGIIGYETGYPNGPAMREPRLTLGPDLVKLVVEIDQFKGRWSPENAVIRKFIENR